MAPGLTSDIPIHSSPPAEEEEEKTSHPAPVKLSGVLDKFSYEDSTPAIGREYLGVNIVDDLLHAPNSDELLRDLAITISRRGVVFFRAQDNLTDELQKQLVQRLGEQTGKPATSTLHVHPVLNSTSEFGVADNEISHISSVARRNLFANNNADNNETLNPRRYDAAQWHSDIQFEPRPADYTSLRLTLVPETGGDTLWASGYEVYERFSAPYRRMFEGLTASFAGDGFLRAAARQPEKVRIYTAPRGSPHNVGADLAAVHPVVRTNPVTGWKSVFAVGPFPKRVRELDVAESKELLEKFYRTILDNHDLQVRFRWRNKNDIAIWDNRSAFHTATFDYQGERFGHRAVGIGETPYLDPSSKARSEALQAEGALW